MFSSSKKGIHVLILLLMFSKIHLMLPLFQVSAIEQDMIEVDPDTKEMLKVLVRLVFIPSKTAYIFQNNKIMINWRLILCVNMYSGYSPVLLFEFDLHGNAQLIFIWMVVHQESLWYRGKLQFGNWLFYPYPQHISYINF